jgi:HEAT repeat protein
VTRAFASTYFARYAVLAALGSLIALAGTVSGQTKGEPRENRQDDELRRKMEPLIPSVRAALLGESVEAQRAALAIAADFPPALAAEANLSGTLATFLQKDLKDTEMIALGLKSFGQSKPPATDIGRILSRYARSEKAAVRQASAEALTNLVKNVAPEDRKISAAKDFIAVTVAAIPLIGECLVAKDSGTQRAALEGVKTTVRIVTEVYGSESGGIGDDPKPKDAANRFAPLAPVLKSLAGVIPKIEAPLNSTDAATRMAASRVLETLSTLRQTIISSSAAGTPETPDPFADAWPSLRSAVTARLSDNDPSVRLAVTEALDAVGDVLAARSYLRQATNDRSIFVRWAAGRALGRTAPSKDAAVNTEDVAALSRLAADRDADVRTAAVTAIARFGLAGKPATAAVLAAAGTGDVEPRVAAVKALAAIESDATATVPVLSAALAHDDLRLRRVAASGLVRFGPEARGALPELRKAVISSDPELRLAAAEAILAIEKTPRFKEL